MQKEQVQTEQAEEQQEQQQEQAEVETAVEQQEEVVQEESPAEQDSEEQPSETESDTQQEDAPEEPVQSKDDEYVFKLKNKDEEVVLDIRNPEHRKQLEENARKGVDYTKKTQVISELEQHLKDERAKVQALNSDPDFIRLGIAKQMNIPAGVLFQDPQPPNNSMKDWDPEGYLQAFNSYDLATKQKALIENTFQMLQKQNADSINTAIVKKARLKYDSVSEDDFGQMLTWASQRFSPDKNGVYPEDSLDIAYKQIFGEKKMEETKLNLSNNFNKKIKDAVKQKPVKTVNQRVEKPAKSSEADFLEFVSGKAGKGYYD